MGKIDGSSQIEKNYAYLIGELAEKINTDKTNLTKEEFYKGLLFGELSSLQIGKYVRKFLLKDKPACVLAVYNDKGKIEETEDRVVHLGRQRYKK